MTARQQRQAQQQEQQAIPGDRALIVQQRALEVNRLFESKRRFFLDLLEGDEKMYARFKALAMNTLARESDLLVKCSPESIFEALRQAAEVKLEVTGVLGEAYIIEYRGQATFQAGYRGLTKLARRSGLVDVVDAHVVYQKDDFRYQLGTDPLIHHIPPPFPEGGRGQPVGAYAWARLRTGEVVVEPMSLAEIEKVRKASKNPNGEKSPWVNWWDEMARKTPTKRLMKRLPLGFDAETVLRWEAETDADGTVEDARPTREEEATQKLRARLASRAQGDDAPGPVAVSAPGVQPEDPEGPREATEEAAYRALCPAVSSDNTPCVVEVDEAGKHGGPHRDATGEHVWPNR